MLLNCKEFFANHWGLMPFLTDTCKNLFFFILNNSVKLKIKYNIGAFAIFLKYRVDACLYKSFSFAMKNVSAL